MAKFMVAVPLPPGNKDKFVQFAGEALGSRRAGHAASRARLGITEERCWVQDLPTGDQLFILNLVGRDPIAGNRQFAVSTDPYDVWFKDEAGPLVGLDLYQPIPVHPLQFHESAPARRQARQCQAFAVPVLPGKGQLCDALAAEVNGPRQADHDDFYRRIGVTEDWYRQTTPEADLWLVYLEGDNLAAGIGAFARSQHPHDLWSKQQILAATGLDWNAPPSGPLPELVMDWQAD